VSGSGLLLAGYLLVPLLGAVIALFVFVFWGQAFIERARRRRASQTAQQVWRELLAGRVCAIPALMLSAAWLAGGAFVLEPLSPNWFVYGAPCLLAMRLVLDALFSTVEVYRGLMRGWADLQYTPLAQRAHKLIAEAETWAAARSAPAGGAS
jgi:hypothetical protein